MARSGGRRCIVTGRELDRTGLVRFVIGPDRTVVPDISAKLPGRGMWVTASREALDKAVKDGLFGRRARGAREAAPSVDDGLSDLVARLLDRSCLNLLGLARRAGKVALGYEKARALSASGSMAVLVLAADASDATKSKAAHLRNRLPIIDLWPRQDLGLALGRHNVVHAAVISSRLADRLLDEVARRAEF